MLKDSLRVVVSSLATITTFDVASTPLLTRYEGGETAVLSVGENMSFRNPTTGSRG